MLPGIARFAGCRWNRRRARSPMTKTAIVDGARIRAGTEAYMRTDGVKLDSSLAERLRELEEKARTTILIARDETVIGLIGISDPIKETTPEAVRRLHKLGVKVIMATGDNEATTTASGFRSQRVCFTRSSVCFSAR